MIKLPVGIEEPITFKDMENDQEFEAIVLSDEIEHLAYIPTDVRPNADEDAEEIVNRIISHDELTYRSEALADALRKAATNYDLWASGSHKELCWCRGWDFEIWEGCKGEPQCIQAKNALKGELKCTK